MRDNNARIAVLEKTMTRIEDYMKEGTGLRVQNIQALAEIKAGMNDLAKYTMRCDNERASQEERIRVLEDNSNKQKGWVAAISFIVSVATGGIWEFIKK